MERIRVKRHNLIITDETAQFPRVAAEWICNKIAGILASRGQCSLALAGGETPRSVYAQLAGADLRSRVDWQKVEFYFGDERCVPLDHSDSNYRMANESLFSNLPIRPEQIKRIHAEMPDRDKAAADYEAEMPDKLDLTLLGMGDDGHTASLFPGSSALDEKEKRLVAVKGPKPPQWRISITPPVIASASSILVMIAGKGKAPMVAHALQGPFVPKEVPIQLAIDGTWIIDAAAAEKLDNV